MKKNIVLIALIFTSCTHSEYKRKPADTTLTIGLYMNNFGVVNGSPIYRLSRDTFEFDTINDETQKKIWKRDTAYYVPVQVPLLDSFKKPKFDSLGNPLSTTQYQLTNRKNILQDFNRKL